MSPTHICSDDVKNGDETDVDCGGSICTAKCANDMGCKDDSDCASDNCNVDQCKGCKRYDTFWGEKNCDELISLHSEDPKFNCEYLEGSLYEMNCYGCSCATCFDGEKNGDETDVDCGGGACAAPWTKHAKKHCDSDKAAPTAYGSLAEAQAACLGNAACHGVYDLGCDGSGSFYQCQAASTWDASAGSCVYALPVAGMCADGQACADGARDCASRRCDAVTKKCASCSDGVQNGGETDVDCGGGACATTCAAGLNCTIGTDCASGQCDAVTKKCASCSDSVQNGDETDIDCGGGACATTCADGQACADGTDCASGRCDPDTNTCGSCSDGVQNGDETDVDCGGGACAAHWTKHAKKRCDSNKAVETPYWSLADAQAACMDNAACHGVYDLGCDNMNSFYQCQAASTWEASALSCVYAGLRSTCADGQACADGTDCASGQCDAVTKKCASCSDGVQNGDETDVDCGGGACATTCADGLNCTIGTDCASGQCDAVTKKCASCSDGVQNGDETDIDCGGNACAKCTYGQMCAVGARDCASWACDTAVTSTCGKIAAEVQYGGAPFDASVNLDVGTYVLAMRDDYGDGWNGAEFSITALSISFNGPPLGVTAPDESMGNFDVTEAGTYRVTVGAGYYPDEVSWTLSTVQFVPVTCFDGAPNGDETDVDCGGGACNKCATGLNCTMGSDCASGTCEHETCV